MVSLIEVAVLSIVQGVCEWFPVSSSGHLAIFHNIFGFQSLSFDVFLHFASIFAVFVFFWKEIISLIDIRKKHNIRYLVLFLIGIIPAGIVGVFFHKQIESFFSSLFHLGVFFIISGIIVYSTKFSKERKDQMSLFDSLFIGVFQAIAILPGVSRSGSTISAGLFRGLKKEEAIRFSFFMAIPLILGASLLEFKDLVISNINYSFLTISFIITFFVSLFTIKILLKIVRSDRFYLFGIYNFLIGILVLIWSFYG